MQNDEIVRISYTTCDLHVPFQEMIEFVHVDIHEQLRSEIAKWKALWRYDSSLLDRISKRYIGSETVDDLRDEPYDFFVPDAMFQNILQDLVIDVGEEFSDVTFQDPHGSRVIVRNFTDVFPEAVDSAVRALGASAGVRIEDEFRIKIGI